MSVFSNVRNAVQKRVAYIRLKQELESMPAKTAADLGLTRDDAARIASQAIYG